MKSSYNLSFTLVWSRHYSNSQEATQYSYWITHSPPRRSPTRVTRAAAPSQTLAAAPSLPSPCHAAAGASRRHGHAARRDGGGGAPPLLAIWWRRWQRDDGSPPTWVAWNPAGAPAVAIGGDGWCPAGAWGWRQIPFSLARPFLLSWRRRRHWPGSLDPVLGGWIRCPCGRIWSSGTWIRLPLEGLERAVPGQGGGGGDSKGCRHRCSTAGSDATGQGAAPTGVGHVSGGG